MQYGTRMLRKGNNGRRQAFRLRDFLQFIDQEPMSQMNSVEETDGSNQSFPYSFNEKAKVHKTNGN